MTPSISVRDVHVSRGRKVVLSGVTWDIESGVVALLGPNGAGKTTLLRCVTGLLRASHGDVLIGDRPIADGSAVQRRLGFVPQAPSLPSLARVRDVVSYAAWLSEVPRDRLAGAVHEALDAMNVADLADRRIRTLSGGQRQRVALATGIVHDPAVLILDEPTVGLDPGQRLTVRSVIAEIAMTRPVVLSTHMTEDVQYLADTVAVLVGGRVQFHGPTADLAKRFTDDGEKGIGSAFERGYESLMLEFGGSE